MTAAFTTPMPGSPDLTFAQSESKAVGMRGSLMDRLRDNAPRIVGLMKIGMDVTVALSGSGWWIAYAAFAITGRLISIAYGSKGHQEKLAEEKADGKHQKILGHSLRENDRKILFPRKYPVESSAGLSTVAETFGVGFGIANHKLTPLITGLIAVWSYGNIVFHREKRKKEETATGKSEPLVFAKSESKPVGFIGRIRRAMKDNPVFTSSMVNVSICAGMILGGLIEGAAITYFAAAIIGGLANLTQGLLVRKHDYNVEGAAAKPATFEEKLARQRTRDNDFGMQPA